ncbi:hypothetical protein ACGFI9_31885 [Micromonospora sp. NPDC048930]|uniref:hypothetical protein n=1 Tax=Micromonospora sp. NPDC048930 TaxID=3364261 RepID=UPI0037155F02
MASGKKLADAYLELRADDSKLTPDVKVKAQRVGKEFGGQLNRALKALSLDPVDVKADPKSALASIAVTRDRLRQLSNDADSVEMRIRTERALTQVERFRKQLGGVDDDPVTVQADPSPAQRQIEQLRRQITALGLDPVDLDADPTAALVAIKRVDAELRRLSGEAATVHVRVDAEHARASLARFRKQLGDAGGDAGVDAAFSFAAQLSAKLGPLLARLPLSPQLAAALAVAGAAAAPGLAATISAAILGGAGAGGIIGGVTIASRHPAVKASATYTGDLFSQALERAGVSFVPATLDALAQVRGEIPEIEHDLTRALSAASRFVGPLTSDFLAGAREGVDGFADAVERAGPVVDVLGSIAERSGRLIGDMLTGASEHAPEAARALALLWQMFEFGTRSIFGTIETLSTAYGWFLKLSAAVTGNTELLGRLAAEEANAKASGGDLSQGLQDLLNGFTQAGTGAASMGAQVRSLKQIIDDFTGQALDARQASRDYEAAIDAATEAVKRNGVGLDIGTAKGRANQQALDELVRTTQRKAQATFEMTQDQEKANAVTEQGKTAFIQAATAMGMSATKARELANSLFQIPDVDRTVTIRNKQALDAIHAVQQSLGKIKDLHVGVYYDIHGNLKLPGGTQIKGAAGGGPVDDAPGPKGVDSQLYALAKGEHVFAADEVDRLGGQRAVLALRRQIMSWPTGWRPGTTTMAPAAVATSRPRVMDSGGHLMPGWNPPIWNGTGRPEPVTTARSMDALTAEMQATRRDVVDALEAVVDAVGGVAPAVGRAINGVGQTLAIRGRTGAWPR